MKRRKIHWQDLAEVSNILSNRITELTPQDPCLRSLVHGFVAMTDMPKTLARNYEGLDNRDEPITSATRDHPGFQWLENQEDIQSGLQSFLCQLRDKELPMWLLKIREVQFYYFAALGGGMACNPEFKPTTFSKDDKRQAVKIANSLKTLVDDDIWRLRYTERDMLIDLLSRFIEALESPSPREYSGPADRERYILKTISRCFLNFELGSNASIARIVANIGTAYGFSLGQRTYERYVEKARSE